MRSASAFRAGRSRIFWCDMESCVARPVRGDPAALKLLRHYLAFQREHAPVRSAALQQFAVSHVYDLLALVLGATRDAAENAKARGASAALLCAIKSDIGANLMNGDLSVADIASRHRVTPRYVQILFEREGTTLTRFIREQRLARAYRMLASPRFDGSRVIDIAFACGFNDVSFFNRCFRARYSATPSDIRSARRISEPGGRASPN